MGASSITETIRPATVADAPGCALVYAPAVQHGTGTFETEAPDAEEMARRIGHVLGRGWPWLVALRADGTVAGYAYAAQFRDRAAYRHTGETSVYIAPDAQGRGLGRRLGHALLAAAETAGFETLIAVIGDRDNRASIALHRALGFRDIGVLTGVGRKFGRTLDVVLMQR